MAETGHLLA